MDFYHSPVAVWVNSAPQPKRWGPRAHRGISQWETCWIYDIESKLAAAGSDWALLAIVIVGEANPAARYTCHSANLSLIIWCYLSKLNIAHANPQQQPQPQQAPPQHIAQPQLFGAAVGRQLSNLRMELKMSQVAPHIRQFNGEGHQRFVDWMKDMKNWPSGDFRMALERPLWVNGAGCLPLRVAMLPKGG